MNNWSGQWRINLDDKSRGPVLNGLQVFENVALTPYERELHRPGTQSFKRPNICAHGGTECPREPEFSVVSPGYSVSACPTHMFGAIFEAMNLTRRRSA